MSWKQFSRLQKAMCFCEKLTLLHLVPIDEAPASSAMLRAVCVLCCCVLCWSPDWHVRSWARLPRRTRRSVSPPRCGSNSVKARMYPRSSSCVYAVKFRWTQHSLMCGRVSRMMLRNSFATCCGAESRTRSQGISSASPGRACMSVSIASIMSKRASCVIRTRAGAERVVHKGALGRSSSHRQSVSICRLSCLAASVTVTKAREAKTLVVGPPTLACWNHAHSCLVQIPYAILWVSEAIAQVDDAQLQEFAFSDIASLTRPVAGASRRELPW